MDVSQVVLFIGLLIFFSHFCKELFDKIKIPNVLLLMIIGLILGPIMNITVPEDFGGVGEVFTTVTLILILFDSGINLKFASLKSSLGRATMVTVFNFVMISLVIGVAMHFLASLSWLSSFMFAAIVGGTSSAVVIPVLQQMKLRKDTETVLLLESALSDVLCLAVALALLEAQRIGVLEMDRIAFTMFKAIFLAVALGAGAAVFWSIILNNFKSFSNSLFTTGAFVFLVYSITQLLEYNGGIAVLSFGIILGNIETTKPSFIKKWKVLEPISLGENGKSFFAELVFVFATFFFVFIGISVKPANFSVYVISLIVTVLFFVLRPLVMYIFRKRYSLQELAIMSVMSPKGLITAVLASLPLKYGLEGGEIIRDIAFSIVLISISITSVMILLVNKSNLVKNGYGKFFGPKAGMNLPVEPDNSAEIFNEAAVLSEEVVEKADNSGSFPQ